MVLSSSGESYQIVGGTSSLVYPPKPPSKVNTGLRCYTTPIYRIALYDSNGTNEFGIFQLYGTRKVSFINFATVIDSGLAILTLLT